MFSTDGLEHSYCIPFLFLHGKYFPFKNVPVAYLEGNANLYVLQVLQHYVQVAPSTCLLLEPFWAAVAMCRRCYRVLGSVSVCMLPSLPEWLRQQVGGSGDHGPGSTQDLDCRLLPVLCAVIFCLLSSLVNSLEDQKVTSSFTEEIDDLLVIYWFDGFESN